MIERPQPPSSRKEKEDSQSVSALRDEVKSMKQDIAFLKNLLEHLRGEFARLKK